LSFTPLAPVGGVLLIAGGAVFVVTGSYEVVHGKTTAGLLEIGFGLIGAGGGWIGLSKLVASGSYAEEVLQVFGWIHFESGSWAGVAGFISHTRDPVEGTESCGVK
jgi:hypothetical protein